MMSGLIWSLQSRSTISSWVRTEYEKETLVQMTMTRTVNNTRILSWRLFLALAPNRDIKGRKLSDDRALSLICFMLASYSHSILVAWRCPEVFDCDLGEVPPTEVGGIPIGSLCWAPACGLASPATRNSVHVAIRSRVPLPDLLCSLFLRDPVPFLDLPLQLVVVARDHGEVIVCEFAPFFLYGAF